MITRHQQEALERSRLVRVRLAKPQDLGPVPPAEPRTDRSEILRLWCLGWTPKQIQAAGWCTARHVNQLLRRYAVANPRTKPAMRQAVAARYALFAADRAAGMTIRDIALKHSVTRNCVQKWRQKHEPR